MCGICSSPLRDGSDAAPPRRACAATARGGSFLHHSSWTAPWHRPAYRGQDARTAVRHAPASHEHFKGGVRGYGQRIGPTGVPTIAIRRGAWWWMQTETIMEAAEMGRRVPTASLYSHFNMAFSLVQNCIYSDLRPKLCRGGITCQYGGYSCSGKCFIWSEHFILTEHSRRERRATLTSMPQR